MQTSYGYLKGLQEGQVSNDNPVESISLVAESDIGFGKVVQRGESANMMKLLLSGGTPLGVTGLNLAKAIKMDADSSLISKSDLGGVVREGYVAVVAKVAVKAGDKVYVIPTTSEFTNDATAPNILLGNSTFEGDCGAGDIVEIRVKC